MHSLAAWWLPEIRHIVIYTSFGQTMPIADMRISFFKKNGWSRTLTMARTARFGWIRF